MTADATTEASTVETPFGPVERGPACELHVPRGLPGFGAIDRFLLARLPQHPGPFQLLHGLGDDPVDLIVIAADTLPAGLDADDVDAARTALGIAAADLLVLCIVTLPPRGARQSAQVNLRAPIFVDVARRVAAQVVLPNTSYRFRAPLIAA